MHKARVILTAGLLAAWLSTTGLSVAQPIGQEIKTAPGPGGGILLGDAEAVTITLDTTERYSVAPYKFFAAPRSTREEVAQVRLAAPPEGAADDQLPETFIIQSNADVVGAATLYLPLIKEGGQPFERRLEVLVIDQISRAYQSYLEQTIKSLFPTVTIDVSIANSTTAVLNGYVDRAELVEPITNLVRGFLAARIGGSPGDVTVVNALRVVGAQQVQMQVVVAEVARSKMRELGFNWTWQDLSAMGLVGSLVNGVGDLNPGSAAGAGMGTTGAGTNGTVLFNVSRAGQFSFNGFLRILTTNNLGKILAKPVLVATSGQPAFFNSGGETPLLIPQGNQTLSVEYRPFGTNVRVVPTVLGDGRIRLQIRPEISELSAGNGIVLAGTSVPGFVSRVVETTVELENGQTFALAGLTQANQTAVTTKWPVLGDLPLINWLFQNKSYQQEETELLILVTPYLVDAMDEGVCKLPGRESRVPNGVEFFLGSKFEPPCFDDPYSNKNIKAHGGHGTKVIPHPVKPFDNLGKPLPEFPGSVPMSAVGPRDQAMTFGPGTSTRPNLAPTPTTASKRSVVTSEVPMGHDEVVPSKPESAGPPVFSIKGVKAAPLSTSGPMSTRMDP